MKDSTILKIAVIFVIAYLSAGALLTAKQVQSSEPSLSACYAEEVDTLTDAELIAMGYWSVTDNTDID